MGPHNFPHSLCSAKWRPHSALKGGDPNPLEFLVSVTVVPSRKCVTTFKKLYKTRNLAWR